jgi:hypothetical protein
MTSTSTDDASHTPRSGLVSIAPLAIGAVIAAYVLHAAFGGERTNFADLDLGINTATFYAQHDGDPIHANDFTNAEAVIDGWRRRGARPVGLFLGNSQIHGINQYQPGQENAAAMLFQRFAPQGIDILTFTQASANLKEHYILFEYLLPRLQPKFLILPVVFINQRSFDVRSGVAMCLQDPQTREALEQSDVGRRLLDRYGDLPTEAFDQDSGALRETTQERTEKVLNHWLDEHSPLWALRPEARGRIASDLIRARNTILGISGQSKRHMIKGAFNENVEALTAMLQSAKAHGVQVLLYIAPIRHDIDPPYIPAEYDQFRKQMQELAQEYNVVFADLGDTVPAEYYGVHNARAFGKSSQPDFFHFQEAAHRRLADALAELIDNKILNE